MAEDAKNLFNEKELFIAVVKDWCNQLGITKELTNPGGRELTINNTHIQVSDQDSFEDAVKIARILLDVKKT